MKKMLKKLSLVLLIAALMLTVTGCSASDYKTAMQLMESRDEAAASEMFKALGDYKDSADLAMECDYTVAKDTYDAGQYEKAAELFTALGNYEDSAEQVNACRYAIAQTTYDAGEYEKAAELFTALGDYEDSAEQVSACRYAIAQSAYDAGEYGKAAELFAALGDYKDSAAQAVLTGDKALAEKLLGTWVSDRQAFPGAVVEALNAAFGKNEDAKSLLSCLYESGYLNYNIEFADDGTFTMATDANKVNDMLDNGPYYDLLFLSVLGDCVVKEIKRNADITGITQEDYLPEDGVYLWTELWEIVKKRSATDYIAAILPRKSVVDLIVNNSMIDGMYTVENGEIRLTIGDVERTAVYDEENGTLSFANEDIAGNAADLIARSLIADSLNPHYVYPEESGEVDMRIGSSYGGTARAVIYDKSSDTFSFADDDTAGSLIVFSRA